MANQVLANTKYIGKASSNASPEIDFSVYIPHIPNKYNTKCLPTYAAALSRTSDDYLAAEDLDTIQLELENLLSKVALRYRVIKSEYELLDRDEKRIERKSKLGEKPSSPGKRKREEFRKSKTSVLKHGRNKTSPIYSTAQFQNTTDESVDTLHFVPQHTKEKVILPKNDTPNKFWLSIEPYCMPLTNEDLRLLDDLLEQYSGPLVPPIPELGGHYSSTWHTEEIKDVRNISNSSSFKSKTNATSSKLFPKTDIVLDECVTGPLTQRLVSALIEDNLRNDFSNADSNSSSENTNSSNYTFRPFSLLKNGIDIEKRLKKELMLQGLVDYTDSSKDENDEILSEIKKLMSELSAVSDYNSNTLKNLRQVACGEIKRLETKRKLDIVDHEIIETYKRVLNYKSKRKCLTPEEQQDVIRLTSEQKNISDKLDSLKY